MDSGCLVLLQDHDMILRVDIPEQVYLCPPRRHPVSGLCVVLDEVWGNIHLNCSDMT